MGVNLKILVVLALLGLATAEAATQEKKVYIDGFYGTGFKLNTTWSGSSNPDAVTVFWNDTKLFEYKPDKEFKDEHELGGIKFEYKCKSAKVDDNIGTCDITGNVTKEVTETTFKVQASWKDLQEKDWPSITKDIYRFDPVEHKVENGNKLQCSSRSVPIPQITWKVMKDNQNESLLVNKTEYHDSFAWNTATKVWDIKTTYEAKKEKSNVICCLKIESSQKELCHIFQVNSSGRFDAPGLYAVLLLIFAYISKSIV